MRTKFFLAVMGRVVPMTVAFAAVIFAPSNGAKAWFYIGAAALIMTGEYFGVYRPLQNFEETRRKLLEYFFVPFADSAKIDEHPASIRINVMRVCWTFMGRHFFQFYQAKMLGHPDASLNFSIRKGVAGRALRSKSANLEVCVANALYDTFWPRNSLFTPFKVRE